jgi:biotin transporter BioY
MNSIILEDLTSQILLLQFLIFVPLWIIIIAFIAITIKDHKRNKK